MSKFIVIRKDVTLDPVVIESEGLTIGRLIGNDLALNHPTVSRTHAGIKEIDGDYWIFNLSEANGTLLNGEQIEKTPLADGDLIQIGPFFLYPKYDDKDLRLEIEMTVNPLPVEASSASQMILPAEQRKTMLLDPRSMGRLNVQAQLQREKVTPKGTRRLTGTGMLTGRLTPLDEQALKIFWDKRKREAGKLGADSPLKPKARPRLGKAQFNWYPTRDLQFSWPSALFSWGVIIVTVLSVSATFIFKDAYSPGPLSSPHFRRDLSINPAIAKNANNSTCTTCHAANAPMNQNCASCHATTAFSSNVSDIHMKVGLTCVDCHSEHRGRGFRPRLVANVNCTRCHRDGSEYKSPLTGKLLKTPHGGVTGYPVIDGRWLWAGISQAEWQRKELPGATSQYSLKEQFHLIHLGGNVKGRCNCTDCHKAGFEGAAVTQGVRESCVACHGATEAAAEAQTASARRGFADRAMNLTVGARANDPQCVSCHAQHGEEKQLRASLRRMER
ncbi:MAG TPA: FHA domain-containing protein [Blastocatellia bacterium]|nr:FHA domain-containing protein [Blastocatellia bacterium]